MYIQSEQYDKNFEKKEGQETLKNALNELRNLIEQEKLEELRSYFNNDDTENFINLTEKLKKYRKGVLLSEFLEQIDFDEDNLSDSWKEILDDIRLFIDNSK